MESKTLNKNGNLNNTRIMLNKRDNKLFIQYISANEMQELC